MILAAGRGERMRPLTDSCPKPLLTVKGVPLIEHHIKNLVAAGIKDIVINHAWLGQKIVDYLGSGEQFSANISYSEEPVALETALAEAFNGHLFLVNNPEHNPNGDFIMADGILANPKNNSQEAYTFSGIALYRKQFFQQEQQGVQPLAPMLRGAAEQGEISASLITSAWTDVGTPERLAKLNTI